MRSVPWSENKNSGEKSEWIIQKCDKNLKMFFSSTLPGIILHRSLDYMQISLTCRFIFSCLAWDWEKLSLLNFPLT